MLLLLYSAGGVAVERSRNPAVYTFVILRSCVLTSKDCTCVAAGVKDLRCDGRGGVDGPVPAAWLSLLPSAIS